MSIALAIILGLTIALAASLLRLFVGPTLYDRALAARSAVTKIALLCAAIAVVAGESAWVDLSFAVLLASLVSALAVLKFFRVRSFQPPLGRGEDAV